MEVGGGRVLCAAVSGAETNVPSLCLFFMVQRLLVLCLCGGILFMQAARGVFSCFNAPAPFCFLHHFCQRASSPPPPFFCSLCHHFLLRSVLPRCWTIVSLIFFCSKRKNGCLTFARILTQSRERRAGRPPRRSCAFNILAQKHMQPSTPPDDDAQACAAGATVAAVADALTPNAEMAQLAAVQNSM